MWNVNLLNGILWGINGLLVAAVAVFAFQCLPLARSVDSHLDGFRREEDIRSGVVAEPQIRKTDEEIKRLRNPIEKESAADPATPVTPFKAALRGTMPGSKGGLAFLKSIARNVELVAFTGEPIRYEGKKYDEFAGWILDEVTRDSATFSNDKQKQTLYIDEKAALAAGGAETVYRTGRPYDVGSYKSRLLKSSSNRVTWGLDPEEIDWAVQNQDAILDRDFRVSVYAGGGLKIDSVAAGSIGAARGLAGGDVVRDINGIPLNSLADVRNLGNHPAIQQSNSIRLNVERAGKTMQIQYRPVERNDENKGGDKKKR